MIATTTSQRTRTAFPRAKARPRGTKTNVGDTERTASLIGGGILGLLGLSRGTLGGLGLAALGGGLIYRGWTGHCDCYAALGVNTASRLGPATSVPARQGVKIEKSVTIQRT